jgi:hypothetical protein
MGGPVRFAAAEAAGKSRRALFSSLARQAGQEPVSRRLLKKVQMQGGARWAE